MVISLLFFDIYYILMQMNQQWMYSDRRTSEYITGLQNFIVVANENRGHNGFMCCPCVHCRNKKDYSNTRTIHAHLLRSGFMPSYNCWTKHGEKGVVMEDNEEEEDDENFYSCGSNQVYVCGMSTKGSHLTYEHCFS